MKYLLILTTLLLVGCGKTKQEHARDWYMYSDSKKQSIKRSFWTTEERVQFIFMTKQVARGVWK